MPAFAEEVSALARALLKGARLEDDMTATTTGEGSGWHVCRGRLFLNDEEVPVSRRVLRIGLAAAGLDASVPCAVLHAADVRRILQIELACLLHGLADEIRRTCLERKEPT